MKDPDKKPADAERTSPPTGTERQSGQPDAGATPRKPRYEFKILPADPKNSFDFEDVADK